MSLLDSLPLSVQLAVYATSSLVVALVFAFGGIWAFRRWSVLDHPERYEHERHRKPIPYSLGVTLFLNFLLLSAVFLDFSYPKLIVVLVF